MRALIATIVISFAAACSHGSRVETGEPSGAQPKSEKSALDGGTASTTPSANPVPPDPGAVTPANLPPNVKIMVRTSPAKGVWVYWGKKKLGMTPLNFDRPRDSGPVDLVLRAQGYFPVHTRAYTVKNEIIGIKLVKLADRMTVYGAKQEIVEDAPDGGTVPPPSTPPVPTTAPPPPTQ